MVATLCPKLRLEAVLAGTGKTDITPKGNVWMDGMIRAHPSVGVHDNLFAQALVLSNGQDTNQTFVLVSVDVCVLDEETTRAVRQGAEAQTGIPAGHIIVAATHTHSGPAAVGIFTPRETAYLQDLTDKLIALIAQAARNLQPVEIGVASGWEDTISHYRRLMADDGHVVMNWEPYPSEHIVGPLGIADSEVGVVKVVAAGDTGSVVGVLFNHAGHPNILSGDNYLLSAEYPGLAARLLEGELGGNALFFNGANGSVDIDGLRDRVWKGLDRAGRALARSVAETARTITCPAACSPVTIRGASTTYTIPGRRITDKEWRWAQGILAATGGKVQALADGMGDDYKAVFYRQLRETDPADLPVEQICLALTRFGDAQESTLDSQNRVSAPAGDDCALLTFPGELYTEIGQYIKAHSPFRRTYIIGLANGYVGYIPTRKAIEEGGYAEDARWVDAAAEELVVEHSLALLRSVYATSTVGTRPPCPH
ncbi:MAG: neutral/alkaline non-lysosomal ceramidase N-terminal domain-containing protein [Chloroflexi bacterium]|nr:neutral/alkaline non-lysosomal ceramidase N-terminal domain-containing protein [Chloroflexota bacterium]